MQLVQGFLQAVLNILSFMQHILDTYLRPQNARIDLASTLLGRSAEYEAAEISQDTSPLPASDDLFDPTKGPPPQQEPIFGTFYWCQNLSNAQIKEWEAYGCPQLPPLDSLLSLPPQNHFVPTKFDLKPLPAGDSDHPLLNCSIKLQITVGKRKVSQVGCLVRRSSIYLLTLFRSNNLSRSPTAAMVSGDGN